MLQERIGGRVGPGGRALRARRAGGARRARGGTVGRLHTAAAPVTHPTRSGGVCAMTTEQAYAEVERLTRRRARNFAYGIMVLPREKRRAIAAIYAFARRVDDVADGELPPEEKREQLEVLRAALDSPPGRRDVGRARRRAQPFPDSRRCVAGARRRRPAGPRADPLRKTSTSSAAIARKSRARSGSRCVAVYGSDDVERAETLGIALQLINIIRDVREDWELGRVYLPQDELASFGVSEDDIAAGRVTDAWRALLRSSRSVRACTSRTASDCWRRSTVAVRSASRRSPVSTARRSTGSRRRGFDVFDGPPHLSALTKLRIVGGGLRR